MLRFILVAIFLCYISLGIPVLGILWLIGKVNKRSADLAALRIVQWGFKVILKIFRCRSDRHRRRPCS